MDPVLGSGEKMGVFWSKVFCTFKSLRNDDGGVIQVGFERDVDSIRNRWQRRIKPESKEFAAILNGFPKKSGENDGATSTPPRRVQEQEQRFFLFHQGLGVSEGSAGLWL